MTAVILEDRGSTASIAPELGFNCYEFKAHLRGRDVDVIDAHPEFIQGQQRPSGSGIPILFPFPNRIREGKFTWDGRAYAIPPPPNRPHAIHGFCLDRPWRVTARTTNSVTGVWQLSVDAPERTVLWPTDCLIEVRYTLSGAALRADIRIANPDVRPMPWGFGTHAYFKLPLGADSDVSHCLIEAPAHQQWELEGNLPTGRRLPVTSDKDIRTGASVHTLSLDDVLTDLRPQGPALTCVIMDVKAGLEVVQSCDPMFRELVVFTPPGRAAVCMEPYTCATDAINLQRQGIDAGWRVMPPGDELRTWIEITARPVLA